MANLIINDPVYGFTNVSRDLHKRVIRHPLFQRLERIRQLGLSAFVYPGATHTRKAHSLGAFTLMHKAFHVLKEKGYFVFDSEQEAAEAAILMHDLGHGPYSHVLESEIVSGISHEDISLMMMEQINEDLHGELSLAIQIFKGEYANPYLHELISSDELDMDRLDYLCRDAFYTGVREGFIGAERLLNLLELTEDNHLTMNPKSKLPMENYFVARRLMYWQVYLHKTTVAAEEVLRAALRRAKQLAAEGRELICSPALHYFLFDYPREGMGERSEFLALYASLDDADVICALKDWQHHDDAELARLSRNFIERRLPKVLVDPEEPEQYAHTKIVEKDGEQHLYAFIERT